MECLILKGAPVALHHLELLTPRIQALKKSGITPALRVVLVGDNPASAIYTRKKAEKCKEIGIDGEVIALPKETTTELLQDCIQQLNKDVTIHGILIQLPLPSHIDEALILETVLPEKDVDGFHNINIGRLQIQDSRALIPCTALGIIKLLEFYEIATSGAHALVLGRSNIVGRPVAQLLSAKIKSAGVSDDSIANSPYSASGDATVTMCHSRTKDIASFTRQADILVAAIGIPLFITGDMIKEGVILVDVGINPTQKNSAYHGRKKIVGDIDQDSIMNKAKAITPVPGGIGPMTIAMLMHNTVQATEMSTTTILASS